jgi:hypothetical protein
MRMYVPLATDALDNSESCSSLNDYPSYYQVVRLVLKSGVNFSFCKEEVG